MPAGTAGYVRQCLVIFGVLRRLGAAHAKRAFKDELELGVLVECEFLSDAGGHYVGSGGADRSTDGGIFRFAGGHASSCSGEGAGGSRLLCNFSRARRSFDFAFVVVGHANRVDSGSIDQFGNERRPTVGSLDVIEREPNSRAAGF